MNTDNIDIYDKGYGLHDTKITNIKKDGDNLILYFAKGVYFLDAAGKEEKLSSQCIINIQLDNFQIDNNIEIIKARKNRYQEISLSVFKMLIEKFSFDINEEFYSNFSKSILFIGYVGKYKLSVVISGIKNISIFI